MVGALDDAYQRLREPSQTEVRSTLLAAESKLEAIKLYRQETGEALKQAKAAVEHAPEALVTGH